MTDPLFSKITAHEANLKKNKANIAYCNETFNKKFGITDCTQQTSIAVKELPNYKYFKTIQLDDILYLRAYLDTNNEQHHIWCKRIYRFLELRLSDIQNRIKRNYPKKEDSILFIQNVITLLLEYYDKTNDSRFLSIALKLLRKKAIAKHGFLNANYHVQYSYNIVAAQQLINNI